MKAYVHDNIDTDQRSDHDSGVTVDVEKLRKLGVEAHHFENLDDVNALAKQRGYVNQDVVSISPETMGGQETYDAKLKIFYSEHLHEDEEIRYILDGEGFFDVRDKEDTWLRCKLSKGDLLILPAGIYHRFTTTSKDYVKAIRLFQAEPKWIPHNRPSDDNQYRLEYLKTYG